MIRKDGKMRCSIVINNRNYGRYLEQCIKSALAQTVAAEVVVVDDGSTDHSRHIIETFEDQIRPIYQENRGQAAAINAGIAAATGDVVALLDSDDWILETKVASINQAFRENPGADWLRHDLVLADEDGGRVEGTLYNFPRVTSPASDYVRYGDTAGTTSCLAFRREFLVSSVGEVPIVFSAYADTYLKCVAALLGANIDVPDALGVRRLHAGQITSRAGGTPARVEGRIRYRQACALRAAELGEQAGHREMASADTWWQHRALVHASCLHSPVTSRCSAWVRYVRSLRRSDLAPLSKLAFGLREGVLALTPRRSFPTLWWLSNDGRPALRRANPGVR